MNIRTAKKTDIPDLIRLLEQVNRIHHDGRPDIFRLGTKYDAQTLSDIIDDKNRPILVAESDGKTVGYAFCVFQQHIGDSILTDIKTLYLDDLCVDENCRGMHIGKELYCAVLDLAKSAGCYNVVLNVWQLNESAAGFYQAMGMKPLKTYMEQIL